MISYLSEHKKLNAVDPGDLDRLNDSVDAFVLDHRAYKRKSHRFTPC
jgi:hypothetical protein